MQLARLSFVLVIASCASASKPQPTRSDSTATAPSSGNEDQSAPEKAADTQSSSAPPPSTPASSVDLTRERTLIDESIAALHASNYQLARGKAIEAVTSLLARPESEHDAPWLSLLDSAGRCAWDALDAQTARTAWQRVLEVSSGTLPKDHPEVLTAQQNFARSLAALGDFQGARPHFANVLEARLRTLPDDHPELQFARRHFARTIGALGDPAGARTLNEKVLEVYSRTLPDDHPDLQIARGFLAGTLSVLGDLARARALYEKMLDVGSRTLPSEHATVQWARASLAGILYLLGDLPGARTLQEKVLAVYSRTLTDDHPELQVARGQLAGTLYMLGDLAGAQALFQKMLDVCVSTLSDDHPDLQWARQGLAATIRDLGDQAGALALEEKVLEILMRSLPDWHDDLQVARQNLAVTLKALGNLAGARALEEKVLEIRSRTLPQDHPDLQLARGSLAWTVAREACSAAMCTEEGERNKDRERERCAELVLSMCRAQTRAAREALLQASAREAQARCESLAGTLDTSLSFAAGVGLFDPISELDRESFVLGEMTRGAALSSAILIRAGAGAPKYHESRETLRRYSEELSHLMQRGTTSEGFQAALTHRDAAQRELVRLSLELSADALSGLDFDIDLQASLSSQDALVSYRRYMRKTLAPGTPGAASVRDVCVAESVDRLCAFVVRSSNTVSAGGNRADVRADGYPTRPALIIVDLGPIAPIEKVVRAWRLSLGSGAEGRGIGAIASTADAVKTKERGMLLRQRVLDPLQDALRGVNHVIFALDDVLHLVPLDALPAEDGTASVGADVLLGDRLRIETRMTLTELLQRPAPLKGTDQLVAIGDVEYEPERPHESRETPPLAAADLTHRAAKDAGILRGSAWSEGFATLPATGIEVQGIAQCFVDHFGADTAPEVCDRANATRERVLELAPQARWLHIATHGWFAPESIKSWSDSEPLDKQSGLAMRMSGTEQVKGMSPMLLCGLALAGANLPETATGRMPGLVTAEELSTLDLTNCELAVLSACDTNVGERRAGQGVASLQMALQMAGARSVITSLWKVPDEATKELMLDFYRRLWVEKKPKWQALWEAKKMMREAKDESGALKYTTRDWAAWVLTGAPE